MPPEEHRLEAFGEGIYTKEMSRKTYQALLARAKDALQQGRPVILDAAYLKDGERRKAEGLAEQLGVPFFILEVTCSDAEVKRRLSTRLQEGGAISDGRWEIYLSQQEIRDPISGFPRDRHFVIDTSVTQDRHLDLEKTILLTLET